MTTVSSGRAHKQPENTIVTPATVTHKSEPRAPKLERNSPVNVPLYMSLAGKIINAVAPRAASSIAAQLWISPPRAKKQTKIEGGQIHQVGVIETQVFGEGPNVYLAHGWGGYRGQLGSLVQPLVAAGYRVVTYDAPSHGSSQPGVFGPGKTTFYEMADALGNVIAHYGPAKAVVAHSMGGAATSLGVAGNVQAERVVLICPPADPIQFAGPFGKALGLGDRAIKRMNAKIERTAGHARISGDIVTQVSRAAESLPPAMVIADRKDKEVDYRDGVAIAQVWPDATLRVTDGLGHRRILKDADTINAVVTFIGQEV